MGMAILANTITADMGLIPGLAIAGPAMGLPLSMLAGFLERPFVTRAGVGRHALCYSLQANLISLLVGYVGLIVCLVVVTPMSFRIGEGVMFCAWPLVSIAVSILVESAYLARKVPVGGALNRGWIIAANLFSVGVIIGILVAVQTLQHTTLPWLLWPYYPMLRIAGWVVSIAVFVGAFIVPRRGRAAVNAGSTVPSDPGKAEASIHNGSLD